MDYRIGKEIVTMKTIGLRLRVMDTRHIGRDGRECYLVQKETADHPMGGLFSVRPEAVHYDAGPSYSFERISS